LAIPQSGADNMALKNAEAARAITAEFSLDHWSEKLLERSLAEVTSPEGKSELLLARCDVLRLKARRKINDNERLPALGDAGTAYVEFLASGPGAERKVLAQKNLGALSKMYGETLVRLIEADEIATADRAAATTTAEAIFKTALSGMNTVITDWEALDGEDPEKSLTRFSVYFPTVFNRAMVYLYWAQLHEPGSLERDQRANQAIDALGDFALGAPFLQSQLAYKAMADCYVALGDYEDSGDYFEYVLNNITQLLDESGSDLDAAYLDLLNDVVQETNHGMMKMLQLSGEIARFWETYDGMMAWLEEERIDPGRPGYKAMLTAAKQMIQDGRATEAIELSARVAEENQNSPLRLHANSVMGKAIAVAPPGADIPLDVLYGAAEGAFFQKEYATAIDGFRLLIPRLAGSRDADKYGAHAYYLLGLCWAKLDMPLLSAVTHQVGVQDYGDDDDWALKNAQKWQVLATRFYNLDTTDEVLKAFNDKAVEEVVIRDGGGDDLIYKQAKQSHDLAKKALRAKKDGAELKRLYAKAISGYQAVPTDSSNYEKALLGAAICENESIAFDSSAANRALALVQDYLENFITDPANAPQDPRQRKIRSEGEPTAVFYLGHTFRALAKAGDASKWQDVLNAFEGMVDKYPDQPDLTHAGMSYRVEAFLRVMQNSDAISEYEAMLALPAGKSRLSIAAFYIYQAYSGLVTTADPDMEIDALWALKGEQAKYLSDYNRYSRSPRLSNLVIEADLWAALGDYKKSSVLFQRVMDDYSKDAAYSTAMHFKVRMGLVESLLQIRQLGVAVPLVEELATEKPKNLRVMIAVVKVKAGFLVYEDGKVIEVPGEGTTEALEQATAMASTLVKLAKSNAGKEDPPVNYFRFGPWWEAKLMYGYVLYQRNLTNPADSGKHKKSVESLQKQAPQLGENVLGKRMSESLRWLLNH
jgi:tetratricopeptide (TPR) repeat protein